MAENKNAKTPADGPEYERGFVDGMQRQMQLHVNRVIKTWHERCEEHPDHQERIISERMIQARMQEEIDELRQALIMFQRSTKIFGPGLEELLNSAGFYRKREWVGLTDDEIDELVARFARYELLRRVEAKLKEKNR